MAEDPAATGVGEEERLPWLQRTDEDIDAKRSRGRLAAYGGIGLIILVVAVALFAFLPHRSSVPTTDAVDSNLLASDQNLVASPSEPAPTPAKGQAGARVHRQHRQPRIATAEATRHLGNAPSNVSRSLHDATRTAARSPARPVATHSSRRQVPNRRVLRSAAQHRERLVRGPSEIVQLGAFASARAAERAWSERLEGGRFEGSPHRIERARVHGRTLYRLRVQVPAARDGCGRRLARRGRCMIIGRRG